MSLLDIHANITYSLIAPVLGLEPISKYTVAAKCPYCGAHAWTIYQDSRNLEEWHYCSQCKVTGSIIAMAAERLEMSEIEAIGYLADYLNQPVSETSLLKYQKTLDLLENHRRFWEHARKCLQKPTNDQLRYLTHLGWNVRSPMSPERLMEGPASLYGLADPRMAKKMLCDGVRLREILVAIPYFKTPKTISGFCLLSPKRELHSNLGGFMEPGFAGLQSLEKMQSEKVIVTSMLKNMIHLQMRHFSSNSNPLPMLSNRQATLACKQQKWSILDGRQLVIWEREPTAAVIHQAMMCDGQLSFVGPETKREKPKEAHGSRWRSWISHDPAIDIWRKIARTAKPYKDALKNWARLATPEQKVSLLRDAEQYETHTAGLVRSILKPKLASKVGRLVRVHINGKSQHSFGHTVILEQNGKWYSQQGQVRFPGIVRVTHFVVRPSGDKEYVGYLKVGDKQADFRVPQKQATLSWLYNFGFQHEMFMQHDQTINPYRNHKSDKFNPFEAATHFEIPEVVKGLDRIGWDGAGFQFRSARLVGGVFHQNPDFKLPDDAPGPKQNYCRMREEVKTALQRDGVEMEITWSLAIALCAQITAPVVDLHPSGICLHRQTYDPFVRALFNRFELRKGSYTDWLHFWPRYLSNSGQAIAKDDSGFFITRYRQLPAVREMLVVTINDTDLQPRMVTHSADKILLNYLRYFSQQQHKFPGDWERWVEKTVEYMQAAFPFVKSEAFKKASERVSVL